MCLNIYVRDPAGSGALGRVDAGTGALEVIRSAGGGATISEQGACACSLLGDDADWGQPTWALRPDVTAPLAATIRALTATLPHGFTLEVLDGDETSEREQRVTGEELAALAASNRIAQRTRYVVALRQRHD